MRERSRYAHLFKDPDVSRLYENTARGSPISAGIRFRRLGSFCDELKTSPKELASKSGDELFNLFLDYVSAMEKQGRAGSYISNTVKDVKAWLAFRGISVRRKIRIQGATETPSLEHEKVPSLDELKAILRAGDAKARAACALVSQSGLRLEVLGNYLGVDGLRVGDLPEMKISDGEVTFTRVPTMVVVGKSLSKTRRQYFSFLSEEGCQCLKEYLEERMRRGERLSEDSAVITPKEGMKPFIRTINTGDAIRKAMRNAKFPGRPYVLRSFLIPR